MHIVWRNHRAAVVLSAALLLAAFSGAGNSSASTFTTLRSFCTRSSCSDGRQPSGALVSDSAGNLYGTTEAGGSAKGCGEDSGCGVIYELRNARSKNHGPFGVLYDFCKKDCKQGEAPTGGLVVDVNGNLYGVAAAGGEFENGAIFKYSPSTGVYQVIYRFCSETNCKDGGQPLSTSYPLTYQGAAAGQPYDGVSPLYGTTDVGGDTNNGVVYKLRPNGDHWKYRVLYSFCPLNGCADGAIPNDVIADGLGNLYGTTFAGGNLNDEFRIGAGVVFKISGGTYQKLYAFCAVTGCPDGEYPKDSSVFDGSGNLIGVTDKGGNTDSGTLFKLDAGGSYTKLYDFCSQTNCADGLFPTGDPVVNADGSLTGTASGGGSGNGGVIYKFDGTLHVLYNFCVGGFGCSDGDAPHGRLISDGLGNYYGNTLGGGTGQVGTVFEFTP